MPGGRPRNLRKGDIAERLAEFVLDGLAFTTPVPRQEDVGHDFHCALIDHSIEGPNLVAGPSFVVQVKSRKQPVVYESDIAIDWIARQENPLFICYVSVPELRVELYSTWTLLEGLLKYGRSKTVLEPDVDTESANVTLDEGVLHIPLGPPVLSLHVGDVVDSDQTAKWSNVLRDWITIDRLNIVNREGKIHWIQGPHSYKTNEPLSQEDRFRVSFYTNPKNLESSLRNLTKALTLLRLEATHYVASSDRTISPDKLNAIDRALEALWVELGPSARSAI